MNYFKYVILLFLTQFLYPDLYSQEYGNRKKIDSLRLVFCFDCKVDTPKMELPPPLPGTYKPREDFHCIKKYNIPDSIFQMIYPFNADSILIAIPENYKDPNSSIVMRGKLSPDKIGKLGSILYNYDYRKKELVTEIFFAVEKAYPPDVLILFYNNQHINHLYLFFEGNKIRLVDSFCKDIYWGEYCEEMIYLLKEFLFKNYQIKIHEFNDIDHI